MVEHRDRRTLLQITERCLLPGTEVHSDDWGACRDLERLVANVASHKVVVHAGKFVEPVTGVHTQEIESRWNELKLGIKSRKGVRRCDLQAYLDFKMWCQWRGDRKEHIKENFLPVLAAQFVSNPV